MDIKKEARAGMPVGAVNAVFKFLYASARVKPLQKFQKEDAQQDQRDIAKPESEC